MVCFEAEKSGKTQICLKEKDVQQQQKTNRLWESGNWECQYKRWESASVLYIRVGWPPEVEVQPLGNRDRSNEPAGSLCLPHTHTSTVCLRFPTTTQYTLVFSEQPLDKFKEKKKKREMRCSTTPSGSMRLWPSFINYRIDSLSLSADKVCHGDTGILPLTIANFHNIRSLTPTRLASAN